MSATPGSSSDPGTQKAPPTVFAVPVNVQNKVLVSKLVSTPTTLPTSGVSFYSYRVKILSKSNKSDCVVRDLRNFHGRFSSLVDMKVKILEELEEFVPPNISFSVGYFDGRQNTKYWLCTPDDLDAMYRAYSSNPRKDIRLWCDGKSADKDFELSRPSKRQKTNDLPKTRREEKEDMVDEIVKELKEKNMEKYELSDAQYSLWARMIVSGVHSSKDSPPQIPLITGITKKRKKSEDEAAVSTAAAAIVKAIGNVSNTQIVNSPINGEACSPLTMPRGSVGVSPGKAADIRGKCFTQLSTLKKLFEEGIVNEEQYEEHKTIILEGLRKL